MSAIEETKASITAFIDKSFGELNAKLGGTQGATIGLSFDPTFVASHVPVSEPIRNGIYTTSDEILMAEVHEHDTANDIVKVSVWEASDASAVKLQVVSAYMFRFIFSKYEKKTEG